jgi:hypothetical protein
MNEAIKYSATYAPWVLNYVNLRKHASAFGRKERRLDVRQAASSAFEDIKIGQIAKSRCYSVEPHDLSAAWAKRRPWRTFIKAFGSHRQSGP